MSISGNWRRGERQHRCYVPLAYASSLPQLRCPKGLVASSDEEVMQKLAKIMGQCGLATLLAFGVGESKRILAREKVCLVLCDEHLVDGNYEDILSASEWSR